MPASFFFADISPRISFFWSRSFVLCVCRAFTTAFCAVSASFTPAFAVFFSSICALSSSVRAFCSAGSASSFTSFSFFRSAFFVSTRAATRSRSSRSCSTVRSSFSRSASSLKRRGLRGPSYERLPPLSPPLPPLSPPLAPFLPPFSPLPPLPPPRLPPFLPPSAGAAVFTSASVIVTYLAAVGEGVEKGVQRNVSVGCVGVLEARSGEGGTEVGEGGGGSFRYRSIRRWLEWLEVLQ